MQVISGAMGKEKIHYQAPDSDHVPYQMKLFLEWVNGNQKIDPVLKAAIAHLWFVTIHPLMMGMDVYPERSLICFSSCR